MTRRISGKTKSKTAGHDPPYMKPIARNSLAMGLAPSLPSADLADLGSDFEDVASRHFLNQLS